MNEPEEGKSSQETEIVQSNGEFGSREKFKTPLEEQFAKAQKAANRRRFQKPETPKPESNS